MKEVEGEVQDALPQVVLLGCPATHFSERPEEKLVYGQCVGGGGWWSLWTGSGDQWSEQGLGNLGCSRTPDEALTLTGQLSLECQVGKI